MAFELFFPNLKDTDAEPYKLDEEHEVYEAVCEEVRKSISDMGSDGYDLMFDDGTNKQPAGFDDLSEDEQSEIVLNAHERGIAHAVTMAAPQIFDDLWVRFKTEEGDTADDDGVTYSKLPDGTSIALREVV